LSIIVQPAKPLDAFNSAAERPKQSYMVTDEEPVLDATLPALAAAVRAAAVALSVFTVTARQTRDTTLIAVLEPCRVSPGRPAPPLLSAITQRR
jgi:hypothetical protein